MVQLNAVAGEQTEVAPPTTYIPACYAGYQVPLDQLPHTSLVQPSGSVEVSCSSHAPLAPTFCPETGSDPSPSQVAILTTDSAPSYLSPQPCIMSPVMVNSNIHPLIFTSSTTDNIPVTDLSSESQPTSGDLASDAGKTFEIIPVKESCSYEVVDNAHAVPSFNPNNLLQTDTRTDSVDSLLESRGYSSDGSDVYMNSDYTDTITSADSTTFLLPVKHSENRNSARHETSCAESSALMSSFYSNEAFSKDGRQHLVTWASEDCVPEEPGEDAALESSETKPWDVSIQLPEEDLGALADREDEENDCEDGECLALQGDTALDNLVNHLAEQHPQEVVDIKIEVLDQPVYPSLTEALEEEQSWLQSTDSLHHYKLLKQGRSTTLTNLRVHTLSNLRANTMNNLHERSSFLNLTAASVTNLGHACQKALSYVRADMEFGSMMSLGNNAFSSSLLPGKQQPPHDVQEMGCGKKGGQATVASGCHTRNMLYMALLVTILLIAVNTTRNLQSSLNQEGGVGIICLAVMFASYTLGSLLSPVLVQCQGVKLCVILGLVLQLLYVAANLYPRLWLMLPASLGGGASLALIWNAMSTYIVLLARGESEYRQKSYQRVSDKYFGMFCLIYQSNLIIGNLVASLVLTFAGGDDGSAPVLVNSSNINSTLPNLPSADGAVTLGTDYLSAMVNGNDTDNSSVAMMQPFDALMDSHYHLCGAEYCHHFVLNQESSAVPERTVYLLFGIFMLLVGAAILIAIFLLEPLSPRPCSSFATPWHNVKRQVLSLVKFSRNAKFLLMLPLLLYSSMQFSFVCSEVMMAYVTCPVGVWLVGYTMIGYGVSCSLASYVTQVLVSRVGRGFFIGLATIINVGLLVFMRVWQPHPDSVLPLFVITTLLGLTDGIWNVNANGLCGSVFPDHYEEAFTGLRVAQGLGGAFSMAFAPFFCMAVKIYVMIGTAVLVLVGYVGAEVLMRRDSRQKNDLLFEKEVV